ncbi:MAG TPA: L-threonylcarbamoyladenylate synthase [Polyangiaceae bacterium]
MTDWRGALEALRAGRVVAAPTESSYGLLADVRQPQALGELLAIKPRGNDKGQPLIVPDAKVWRELVLAPSAHALRLAERFWPGPLTLVTPARDTLDARVTLNDCVAVRVPASCPAAEIVAQYGAALTATSANDPGAPPCLSAVEVGRVFDAAVRAGRLFVVPGTAPGGAPSTLVKLGEGGEGSWRVIREGAIPSAALRRVLNSDPTTP